jgi:hypothetical protein
MTARYELIVGRIQAVRGRDPSAAGAAATAVPDRAAGDRDTSVAERPARAAQW